MGTLSRDYGMHVHVCRHSPDKTAWVRRANPVQSGESNSFVTPSNPLAHPLPPPLIPLWSSKLWLLSNIQRMYVCTCTYDAYNAHSSGVLLMLSYILCRGKKQRHSDNLSHLLCPSQPGGWLGSLSTDIYHCASFMHMSSTMFTSLGWARVSPTLAGLHCKMCVCMLVCLLVAIYRKF